MPLRAVLFDLDGTLLPHDYAAFEPRYLEAVARWCAVAFPGTDAFRLAMAALATMLRNDGSKRNDEQFWETFGARFSPGRDVFEAKYFEFLGVDHPRLRGSIASDPAARAIVEACRRGGLVTVLATNPVFPRPAVEQRMSWAGVDGDLFDLVTTYETMRYCKPHPGYYLEIAEQMRVAPEDCLMVGNDVAMDLVPAAAAGMKTCLVANEYRVLQDGFVPDHACTLAELAKVVVPY
jgi:FMN phosphatase YigB (HAD superfamily)